MTTPPTSFRLVEWPFPPTENVNPLGVYAETYWLPILHPTSYLLGRRLVTILARVGDKPVTLEAINLAHALGIIDREAVDHGGAGLRIYAKAANRLHRYGLVRWRAGSAEVRVRWPRLPDGLLNALPEQMRLAEHDYWLAELGPAADFVEA